MIASLPMYDRPSTRAANDRLWQAIRDIYGRGPRTLDRTRDPHETWIARDLVFSQTCGLPYRSELHRSVQLIGTPDYGVDECPPGYYRSCIVVRDDDQRDALIRYDGARLARNDTRSQSGWAALVTHLRDTATPCRFDDILDTGSHAASVQTVAEGRADIAAIDAVTWALLLRDDPVTRRLRVLARTAPTPGLPYITGPDQDVDALRRAAHEAIAALTSEDRACLLLKGLVQVPAADYLAVPMP